MRGETQKSWDAFEELEEMETALMLDALRRGDYDDVMTSATAGAAMAGLLGLDKSDYYGYFAGFPSLSESYREYWQLSQLPAHHRERDILERTGQDRSRPSSKRGA